MANDERTIERSCGWSEESLFAWFDGDLPERDAAAFSAHLDGCSVCSSERRIYTELFERLSALAAPPVPAGFEAAILARVPRGAVASGRAVGVGAAAGRSGWRALAQRAPRWAPGAALVAAAVLVALAWVASGVDWSSVVGRAVQPVAHLGARVAADGALGLLGAVTVSESFIEIARALEPVGRSIIVVARAFQAEILLVSLLLALTALVGAVRLAAGSVVERGVRRVCLALSI